MYLIIRSKLDHNRKDRAIIMIRTKFKSISISILGYWNFLPNHYLMMLACQLRHERLELQIRSRLGNNQDVSFPRIRIIRMNKLTRLMLMPDNNRQSNEVSPY